MPTWKVLTDTDGNKIVVNLDLVMKVSRYEDAVWGIHAHICATNDNCLYIRQRPRKRGHQCARSRLASGNVFVPLQHGVQSAHMIVLKSEVILRAYKKRGEAVRFPGDWGLASTTDFY
jgi:hypothetical protein